MLSSAGLNCPLRFCLYLRTAITMTTIYYYHVTIKYKTDKPVNRTKQDIHKAPITIENGITILLAKVCVFCK